MPSGFGETHAPKHGRKLKSTSSIEASAKYSVAVGWEVLPDPSEDIGDAASYLSFFGFLTDAAHVF
ncbi:hypothetical protein GCM10023188_32130 [Pontibacter saemangeumensis]|uniref:Uncharacterized protein n=1 Tax=Pontibacter saemangeumensis TaxID=1084525 RepID=A0ABP8LY92_9BACT